MADNLSKRQAEMLTCVSQCAPGRVDTLTNQTLSALARRGLVKATDVRWDFGYDIRRHRANVQKIACWVLTDAGRNALEQVSA